MAPEAYLIERALQVALKSRMTHKHGAIIVANRGKTIIAEAFNSPFDFNFNQRQKQCFLRKLQLPR